MSKPSLYSWGVSAFLLAIVAGCEESVETSRVTGRVTVAGEPLANGLVKFFPDDGGRPISGILDDGDYRVDLPAGDFKVVIQVSVALPEGWREGDPLPPPSVAIPADYSHPKRSPLSLNVTLGPPQKQDFDLGGTR